MEGCIGHRISHQPFLTPKFRLGFPSIRQSPASSQHRKVCRAEQEDNSAVTQDRPDAGSRPVSGGSESQGQGQLNKWIAGGAVALGIALVAFTRISPGQVTLTELQRQSVPLDLALQNGRPTLMEFYANWCEVCNDMAADTAALKSRYGDKLNFVMLNIENSRWLPEMAEYRVSGVPHFVFLDAQGTPQAATIGRLPKEVLDINTKALVEGQRLPFKRKVGETSSAEGTVRPGAMAGPRDHASIAADTSL